MRSIKDIIIELKEPFSEKFKTENGVELYANVDFSQERLSKRIVKVISVPLNHDTPIKNGFELLIDPTILYRQIYREVKQDYQSKVGEDLFKVQPNMIILYRENENSEWKGYLKNALISYVKEEEPLENAFIYIPDNVKNEYKKGFATLVYGNKELFELSCKNGDEIAINPLGGISFWLDGKEYWWIRNVDIYGIIKEVA